MKPFSLLLNFLLLCLALNILARTIRIIVNLVKK